MDKKLIEALLYIQGEKGLYPAQLKSALNDEISTVEARKMIKQFQKEYNSEEHGIFVIEFNDIYKFATKEEYKDAITNMVATIKKQKLSSSAIETAGIIAYKQPITKSQINDIRGVSSEGVVNTLLVKEIIEEKGIAHTPGNPILYGITDKFYDYFRINSLRELPTLNELHETEETEEAFDLFASQRG